MSNKEDIYIISDVHLTVRKPTARLEDTEEEWLAVQKEALLQVKEIVGDDLLIISGDLIDSGRPYGTQAIVNTYADTSPPNTVFISGNHPLESFAGDLDLAIAKGTLGNLIRTKGLQYLPDNTEFEWGEYVIHPFNFKHGRTLEYKEVDKSKHNIVVSHFLSYPKKVPSFITSPAVTARDIIKEFPEYDAYVVGDNHSSFLVEEKYLSPGSLTRRSADQMNHSPAIWKYNKEEGFTPIYLKVKPAEECMTDEHLVSKKAKEGRMDAWAEDLDTEQDFSGDFKEDKKNYYLKNNTKKEVQDMLDGIVSLVELEESK
jgi:DNA repair exonuclease SbcCD nuclease subunit